MLTIDDDDDSGLDFTAQALRRSIENPEEELNTSFTKAYEATLRKHHNMMVRPVFAVSNKWVYWLYRH